MGPLDFSYCADMPLTKTSLAYQVMVIYRYVTSNVGRL